MAARVSILCNTDGYKDSHYLQYPPGTEFVSAYIESRGGEFPSVLFFGLQMFIKEYLLKPFTQDDIEEAAEINALYGTPFNREGWQYILDKYKGYLPIEIQAVPEGTVVPVGNVLVQIKNIDPKCAWVTSFVETALLRAVWYPTTVATQMFHIKQKIANYMQRTCDNLDGLNYKMIDFGARGVSSCESSIIGGLAFAVVFHASDTKAAIIGARRYYNHKCPIGSIAASEHSTVTSWGREHEADAYRNMLKQFAKPGALVANVSDSYNIWNAVDNIWGKELKEEVVNSGAKIIVRPDSGEPAYVAPEVVERLMDNYSYTINSKHCKVLPPCIGALQGDGINYYSIDEILDELESRALSLDNISFGMGGAALQHVNRDTQKFAMKTSAAYIDGEWRDVYKDPITDFGKRSKRGILALIKNENGEFQTIRTSELNGRENFLKPVLLLETLLKDDNFDTIRKRADTYLDV